MIPDPLLVTGGCGFIGSNFILAERRKNPQRKIVNLDALTYAGNPRNLDELESGDGYCFAHGRIGDAGLVARLLAEREIGAVINFAAESHVDRSIDDPTLFLEGNVMETNRLLATVRRHFESLPAARRESFRFLHISTDEVYGELAVGDPPFSESTPFAPNSPYAASKAAGDHLVRVYHRTFGLPVLTTNCSNNYGPFQFPEKLMPVMITRALEGETLPVYGDGTQIRDWLFVRDHVSALAAVLERGRPGETYAVGGSCEHPNLKVVEMLCDLLDRLQPKSDGSYHEQIAFVPDRPGHDFRYALDSSKIKNELGWQPATAFEAGLEETVRWYLTHQEWSREGKKRLARFSGTGSSGAS